VARSSTIGEALPVLSLRHAHSAILAVVGYLDTKTGRVNVAVTEDEKGTKYGLGEKVKDTIEDGLGIRRNDVATLAETECDGVKHPQEESQATAPDEDFADVRTKVTGVATSLEDEHVTNPKESNAAEGEVTPFVGRPDESTNKTSDNHDLIDQDSPHDGRPWHASGEEKVEKEKGSGDEPVVKS